VFSNLDACSAIIASKNSDADSKQGEELHPYCLKFLQQKC